MRLSSQVIFVIYRTGQLPTDSGLGIGVMRCQWRKLHPVASHCLGQPFSQCFMVVFGQWSYTKLVILLLTTSGLESRSQRCFCIRNARPCYWVDLVAGIAADLSISPRRHRAAVGTASGLAKTGRLSTDPDDATNVARLVVIICAEKS